MTTLTTKSLRSVEPAELSDYDLDRMSGGTPSDAFKQMQDMTNNQQTTAQKAAAAADAYIRS